MVRMQQQSHEDEMRHLHLTAFVHMRLGRLQLCWGLREGRYGGNFTAVPKFILYEHNLSG